MMSRAMLATVVVAALVVIIPPVAVDGRRLQPKPGSIRGRLDIRRFANAPSPRPGVAALGRSGSRGVPEIRRGLVYLDAAPRGAFDEPEPVRAVMDQRDETFVPRLVAVTTGSVVAFPNSDRTYHNVFSLSRARRFDLGRYAAGRSKSVRFNRPGIVRVFCDIHSHMSAFIAVFNHQFYRVTEPDGRYRLDGIPPGAYTVVGWYEGSARVRHDLTVTPGAVVELDLVVP